MALALGHPVGHPVDIGSWLDVLRGLVGRLAHIRRKAFRVAAFAGWPRAIVMPHFSDLRVLHHDESVGEGL